MVVDLPHGFPIKHWHKVKRLNPFCCFLIATVLLVHCAAMAYSQPSDGHEFAASELSEMAQRYAGSSVNWPIISELALYDAQKNRFVLLPEHIEKLNRFSNSWQELNAALIVLNDARSAGAQMFAANELLVVQTLLNRHRELINNAHIDGAIFLVNEIIPRIEEVAQLTSNRRIADVEAKLTGRTGIVNQRHGMLGGWFDAVVGSLFQQNDGVRTGRASVAQLLFVDGSDIVLSENTTAIIRKSRVDKLTNRSEVEIELTDGGLLSRLSLQARDESDFKVLSGTSTSNIHSNNFWIEKDSSARVVMSNYDGKVVVKAENEQVNLGDNQGTIVIRGQRPVPPIALLQAPAFLASSNDIIIHSESVRLEWSQVSGAHYYEVEASISQRFDAGVRLFRTNATSHLLTSLADGVSFVRVRAYDENGLRGMNSEPLRIVRISGSVAPPIILDNRSGDTLYTFEHEFTLSGITEPSAILTVNNVRIPVYSDGRFTAILSVHSEREVTIKAEDASGNVRNISRIIRYVDVERLAEINWSVPVSDNSIKGAPKVLVAGMAYSFMDVIIKTESKQYQIPVGNNGNWSREIDLTQSRSATIVFREREKGRLLKELTFNVLD